MKTIYNSNLKERSRQLRKNGTKGEAVVWKKILRARMMMGYQFNRQFIIGDFIVDFICRKLSLIIEIDGGSHFTNQHKDKIRQKWLEAQGYIIVRFSEKEVLFDLENVYRQINTIVCQLGSR